MHRDELAGTISDDLAQGLIALLQLGDHLGHVLGVDATGLAQGRQVVTGQELEVVEQGPHRRIKAVALDQLQLQTLRNRARHHPGRLEALTQDQHGLDTLGTAAQSFGDLVQIGAQIAALVDPVDQGQGDRVIGGVESGR